MIKLNNKGWGLTTFLVYLFIFLFAIILVAILVNKNGIGPDSESILMPEDELIEKYHGYERIVRDSAITYQEENYPYLSNGDRYVVDIERLDIPSEITKKCSGNVVIEKNNDVYSYKPYLNCGSYQTNN